MKKLNYCQCDVVQFQANFILNVISGFVVCLLLGNSPASEFYMEQTECSETSAYKIQTPGNYPEDSIQHSEHGEVLKSRISGFVFTYVYGVYYCITGYLAFGTLLSAGRKWNLEIVVYLVKRCVTFPLPFYIYVVFLLKIGKEGKPGRVMLGTY